MLNSVSTFAGSWMLGRHLILMTLPARRPQGQKSLRSTRMNSKGDTLLPVPLQPHFLLSVRASVHQFSAKWVCCLRLVVNSCIQRYPSL